MVPWPRSEKSMGWLAKGPAVSIFSDEKVQLRISNQMLTLQPVQLCQDVLSTRRVLVLQAPLKPAPKAGWNIHKSPWPQWSEQIDCINLRGVAAEVSSHIIAGKIWTVLMLRGGRSVSFDCCHWVLYLIPPHFECDECVTKPCVPSVQSEKMFVADVKAMKQRIAHHSEGCGSD